MSEPDMKVYERFPAHTNAALVLADGGVFYGYGIGMEGTSIGEICFNTSMTGYQEILTDPSYAGQIITFTFPHIGNVGTNAEDVEARQSFAKGLIVRAPITDPANFRSTNHLTTWLIDNNLSGIAGVDTRALTRHVRLQGPQNVGICFYEDESKRDLKSLLEKVRAFPSMQGRELAKEVTCAAPYEWKQTSWKFGEGYGDIQNTRYHVVAVDFGAKLNILRCLAELGCKVTVVPATTSAQDILTYEPDGVFLSNGPGDPEATGEYAVPMIQEIIAANIPVFGICLGHQLLSRTLGCETTKMHQGHRGANHPVKRIENGRVEITSQNHGFVVTKERLPMGITETHMSLFDSTLEGIKLEGKPVFSVQHHPEASPGPRDSFYLFNQFVELMEAKRHA